MAYDWQYIDRDIVMAIEPHLVASVRTLQDQLRGLTSLGYLKPTERYSRTDKYLYSITSKGVSVLRDLKGDYSLVRTSDNVINPLFVDHARAVSWFQTHIELVARRRPDLSVLKYERRYHHPDRSLWPGWIPDVGAVVARQQADDYRVALYVAERDRGRMSPHKVFSKLEQSNRWYQGPGRDYLRQLYTAHGASYPKATYHRLIVTEHRRSGSDFDRLTTLYTHALRFDDHERRNMYFATAEDIDAQVGYDRPIWYPINTYHRSWRQSIAGALERSPEDVYSEVGKRLRQLDRLALFPPQR